MEAATGVTPKSLRDRPALRPHLAHFMEAFYELSSQREISETPQPLKISEVLAYAQLTQLDSAEGRGQLLNLLRKMDAAYLQRVRAKLSK